MAPANTVCLKRFTIYEHDTNLRLSDSACAWRGVAWRKGSAVGAGLGIVLLRGGPQKAARKVRTNYNASPRHELLWAGRA